MSERGIQIEGNVFCPVCECYMSQEIMCNRKNAETQEILEKADDPAPVAGGVFAFVRSPDAMLFFTSSKKHSPVSLTVKFAPLPRSGEGSAGSSGYKLDIICI